MSRFKELYNKIKLILEAGEAAGKLELVKTSVKEARVYAESIFAENDRILDNEIPNFDKNYQYAQMQAGTGKTKRKDMPVIDDKDVKDFQRRLESGLIDINTPHAKSTDISNPFPEGLSGEFAKHFLERGIKIHDGSNKDDIVNVFNQKVRVGDLKPIQKQIYFDKSIAAIAQGGAEGSRKFLTSKTFFIISSDKYILDGHHRYLSGLLIDPDMKVNTVTVDLPLGTLLPLTLAYGDARGNKRNA